MQKLYKYTKSPVLYSFIHSFIYIRQDQSEAITVKTDSGALYSNILVAVTIINTNVIHDVKPL